MCHFLKYDELVNDTEQQINKIYDFLEIPRFKHTLQNLTQFKVNGMGYDDTIVGNKMHTIKTEIKKEENPYKAIDTRKYYKSIRSYSIMKILVFGLPGSGKSTFAKQLTAETNIPHFNADEIRGMFKDWDFSQSR
jgi:SpoVK/Ycf46/Vps4 family AAA+-type ATPase